MNRALMILNRSGIWRAAYPEHGDQLGMVLTVNPLPIVCRDSIPVFLDATMAFEYELDQRDGHEGSWKVGIREYIYSLRVDRDPSSEFIAWHWHPRVINRADPHVHVRGDHPEVANLRGLHVPTGRVFFEDVLLFLHDDLDATCSEGGRERLIEMRRRTRKWATWR